MDRIEDAGYYSPFTTSATYVTGSDGTNYRKVELTAGGKPMSFADAVIKEKNTEIELIGTLLGDAADTSEFTSGETVIYVR